MKVVFSKSAINDLQSIGEYIALDSPRRAISFGRELKAHCLTIAKQPLAYPLLDRESASGVRRVPHGSYVIYYRVRNDRVVILHVVSGYLNRDDLTFSDA